ncbi:MAG: DUF4405 domain-containing protein [SAR324 cluster bacterium]|nr:DUF4405 domain-containing protein [SAR324 cluster bacterium]
MKITIRYLIYIFFAAFMLSCSPLFAQQEALDCKECHEDELISEAHSDEDCQGCHETVVDESHEDGNVKPVNCGSCHDELFETMQMDIHHRIKEKMDKDPPDCVTCHGSHDIKAPADSEDPVKDYCSSCHDNLMLTNPFHQAEFVSKESCLECHDDKDYGPQVLRSIHQSLTCVDCHAYIANNLEKHQEEEITYSQKGDCYTCHKSETLEHRESIHGISLKEGIDEAAQCWSCHGSHDVQMVSDKASRVFHINLPRTCGSCHDDPDLIEKYSMTYSPFSKYAESVHGKLVENLAENKKDAANCISCHGVHNIKNRVQPGSKISSFRVPETCGECHQEIAEDYQQSIHWVYAKKGVKESPVCNDCHSEHSIHAINTVDKRAEIQKIQEETCIRCHEDPIVSRRYRSSEGQAQQYQDSYHGLAVMRGDKEAAMCIDCHEAHRILPKKHPQSSVNPDKVTETCKHCHEDATVVFSQSYSHQTESEAARKIEYWVERIYIGLILVVIGGMLLHNLLIFGFEIKKRRQHEKHEVSLPRLTGNEVIQHAVLFTTFIILAITGFALKFPDVWILKWMVWIGITESIRQTIHHWAGVILLLLGSYHLIYLITTSRGRDVLAHLLPRWRDLKELWGNILYYCGLRKSKPEFDQFDYTEKAEYWALVWGTFLMGVTGFVLWFPTIASEWIPYVWFIKVNEIIHFYEAILATLAILVWHWFFVIFHPREYPMSFTWIDGKTTLEHYIAHHKNHFKTTVLEWMEMKSKLRSRDQLSEGSELFIATLEKHNHNPDTVIKSVLDSDPELKLWLDQRIEGKKK